MTSRIDQFRRKIGHVCPVCGKSFTGLKTARYCSNRCRQAAKYARMTAKKGETR